MPRVITDATKAKVKELHKAQPDKIGPALGDAMFDANVPITAVAELLVTTEATVYRWSYGEVEPRPVFHRGIKKLTAILRRALRAGDAPLAGTHAERLAAVADLVIKHKTKPERPS